ncbi:MAG: amidohydrolase [Acidobacteria bacterium]|nr:amidohydrolase [Acidobacteriota bacterium]
MMITNAKIYTVNPQKPWAEALAIRGDKIVAVGSAAEIERYRGPATRVIDAKKHLVLPGFTDCHIHFVSGSISLGQVDLSGAKSVAEMQKRVAEYVAANPGKSWVLGRGWVYSAFGAEALPHKKYLDEILPDRPALLEGYDGHTYWANSRALEMAGVTRDTPDPPNGKIVRDPKTGEPTGALKEAASSLVEKIVPEMTAAQKIEAIERGIREANRNGLVRVHSAGGDFEVLDLYRSLRDAGKLTLRMTIAYFLDPPELKPDATELIESTRRKYNDEWISTDAVKTMLDGVVESHTAAMLQPYSDDASLTGKLFWDAAKYKAAIREIDARGFQIYTHAIGDAAVRLALDAYEEAAKANRKNDARPRIEHIETISPQDVPRFGTLHVIASMQPLHAYPDENTANVWARNVGKERETRAFGWQGIAKTGGRLAFGSDWPVVTLSPWEGLQNAVTRQDHDGRPASGWMPLQRVSLAQAIETYTLGAAIAGRREKTEGSLEPGKLADLVIVSQNLFEIAPHLIAKTEVLLTMVGGKTVYQSKGW